MTNVMTKFTSRQRILAYLSQHQGASAVEISRALRVTPANVRYHLSILGSDGRVQASGTRPQQGSGRPVQIYSLGEAALGDNLAGLAEALLSQFLEKTAGLEREAILKMLSVRLVPIPAAGRNIQLTRRLAQTITTLNQHGYSARWEAHASAPRIIFERCPYAAIIARHPELCRMDVIMLGGQLDGTVQQTAQLEKNDRGTLFCMFELK